MLEFQLVLKLRIRVVAEDLMLYFLFLVFLAGILVSGVSLKAFNYLLAYLFVFFVGYFLLRISLLLGGSFEKVMQGNVLGVFIVCFVGLVEAYLKGVHGIGLSDYIPKIKPDRALQTVFATRMNRVYSLMPEPGILGFYLNTLGLVALGWLRIVGTQFVFRTLFVLWVLTFLFAGSAGALVALIVGVGGLLLRKWMTAPMYVSKRFFMLFPLGIIVVPLTSRLSDEFSFIGKLLDPSANSSGRINNWIDGVIAVKDAGLLGNGLGSVASSREVSYNNWYLMLGADGGLVSLIIVFFVLLLGLIRIWRIQDPLRDWVLVGYVAGVVQLCSISTFYNPYLWALLALVVVLDSKRPFVGPKLSD